MIEARLPYRRPFDWPALLAFFAARAIPGVEQVEGEQYRRVIGHGWLDASNDLTAGAVRLGVHGDVGGAIDRARLVFDLDADAAAIGAHLRRDPVMADRVAQRPGLRVPGTWDGFELAVRAVLGQQVTVVAARTLAGRLVALCGRPVPTGMAGLSHAFPGAAEVACADLDRLGMPAARRATLRTLAHAALADPALLEPPLTPGHDVRLRTLPGVGDWTAQYIQLRALRDPDAFPAGDVGLQRAAGLSAAELVRRAEQWRPWRGYAAQHLWTARVPLAPTPWSPPA